ncbi:hypothetical protein YYC_00331 [Plasmodium yoelii 17X]|uniref:Uncharacterized protein n=2 Tax=Plasmodium yoelii TaxID=5861 RepID=Q7RGZ0_PLAYO|nr:hypothetical protein [Plasmodium yoelii yoelii]ETB62620.1 hypothetical protein YYC_00331 [Plasmodium yoelii 17X]
MNPITLMVVLNIFKYNKKKCEYELNKLKNKNWCTSKSNIQIHITLMIKLDKNNDSHYSNIYKKGKK